MNGWTRSADTPATMPGGSSFSGTGTLKEAIAMRRGRAVVLLATLVAALAGPGRLWAQADSTQPPGPVSVRTAAGDTAPAGSGEEIRLFSALGQYDWREQAALWITL